MSTIVVGIDGSERGRDAVALAARLARDSGAGLALVCAYPDEHLATRFSGGEYEQMLREWAEASIAAARGDAADIDAVAGVAVSDRSPARALQEHAAREGAALIVIGSSHRGGVGRVLAGTTAERLLHGAPCPVAVAPNGYRERDTGRLETIAVAYRDAPEARAALAAATEMARATGARLRVVEVVDTRWAGAAGGAWPAYEIPAGDIEAGVRGRLAKAVGSLPPDITAEPVVAIGEAAHELVEESAHADLMVVGSRGYGPHRAVLLGSVSGRLVREAACPVLVLPRGVEAPLAALFGGTAASPAL